MKNRVNIIILITSVLFSSFTFGLGEKEAGVEFYNGSYDNLLRQARKENKPIILEFWASWCGTCKKMDNETFNDPDLAKYLKANFIIYKVDIDTFDGMEITDKFAVESFPSMLVLDKKAKPLEKLKGFYLPNYLENELKTIVDQYQLYAEDQTQEFALN